MPADIKAALFYEMDNDATLDALVDDRIYPDTADQKTPLPYITYQLISNPGVHNLLGVTPNGLNEARFQITVWAANSQSRTDVQNAVRILLDGKVGVTFGTGATATSIRRSENTTNIDTKDTPKDGSQNTFYGVFMDFEFWLIR